MYRLTLVDEEHEMRWTEYAVSMLLFSGVSMLLLYLIQRTQQILPLNPQKFAAVGTDLAFNTAASFTTNTNWQTYGGEATMSYLTQMAGLAYHNFVSAAVGIALAIAFIRGIRAGRKKPSAISGSTWSAATLWVLLPACIVYALFLVSQGVVQNLEPYDTVQAGRAAAGAEDRRRQTGRRARWQARHGHGHRADNRAGTGRIAGSHQECWAPTAAASSTPTARILLRIPLRSAIFCRCFPFS